MFEFVKDLPPGRKALGSKWVFLAKKDQAGKIVKFKARWVARGELQKKGINYRETFTPVISLTTLRIMLMIVAVLDLEMINWTSFQHS